MGVMYSARLGPNNSFDPRQILGHSCVNSWRIFRGALLTGRRDAYLRVHARVSGVRKLKRTTRIALCDKIEEKQLKPITVNTYSGGFTRGGPRVPDPPPNQGQRRRYLYLYTQYFCFIKKYLSSTSYYFSAPPPITPPEKC